MQNTHIIDGRVAMRDGRGERARRAAVREERLRVTAGVSVPLRLSAWRGRSGQRYVVGVHALAEADLSDVTEAVLIAVCREGDGTARVVDVAAAGALPRERLASSWMSAVRACGATEMHVHRLARDEAERSAVIADLQDDI
ncbi:hypothetical protein [Salinarimonas soli]|uniref:hypothetical protein n=1 Tax=Salinarimonas soli TaxID=1638099 RepID=UPI001F0B2262|nr:hypothetical protein [Salinarimonas soli]